MSNHEHHRTSGAERISGVPHDAVPLWQMLTAARMDGYEVVATDDPNTIGVPLARIDDGPEETW